MLLAYLPVIADTADLVLIETETLDRNDKTFKELAKLAGEGKAELVVCEAPRDEELPSWKALKRGQQKRDVDRLWTWPSTLPPASGATCG